MTFGSAGLLSDPSTSVPIRITSYSDHPALKALLAWPPATPYGVALALRLGLRQPTTWKRLADH